MPYTLDAFCRDCRAALKADPGPGGREAVRQNLERLLAEKSFSTSTYCRRRRAAIRFTRTRSSALSCCAHVNPKASQVAAARSRRVLGDLRPGDANTPT